MTWSKRNGYIQRRHSDISTYVIPSQAFSFSYVCKRQIFWPSNAYKMTINAFLTCFGHNIESAICYTAMLFQTKIGNKSSSFYLFCSSSLANSSNSSGLSWVGEAEEGDDREAVDDATSVCSEEGVATWLAIWLTVCDTEFFTHERVELSLPVTLSVATCGTTTTK